MDKNRPFVITRFESPDEVYIKYVKMDGELEETECRMPDTSSFSFNELAKVIYTSATHYHASADFIIQSESSFGIAIDHFVIPIVFLFSFASELFLKSLLTCRLGKLGEEYQKHDLQFLFGKLSPDIKEKVKGNLLRKTEGENYDYGRFKKDLEKYKMTFVRLRYLSERTATEIGPYFHEIFAAILKETCVDVLGISL